jgi:hypothetical protein
MVVPGPDTAPPVTPGQGAVLYWNFDEGSGTRASDATKRTVLTISASSSPWSPGSAPLRFPNPSALSFDGMNTFAESATPLSPPIQITTAKAVSLWIKPEVGNTSYHIVITLNDGTTGAVIPELQVGYNAGQFGMWVPAESNRALVTSSSPPAPGAWHHIAYVTNGATHQLFIDGVVAGTSTRSLQPINLVAIRVGRAPGTYTQHFRGSVDDLRIYGRALTVAEVGALARGEP